MMINYLFMTQFLRRSCNKYKMTMKHTQVFLLVKKISKMTIVSMTSEGTKKCMTSYITVAHGYICICVKSAMFPIGNHQFQKEGKRCLESQRGNVSWKCW